MIAMSNASWRHPLFVNEYFMRRAKSFMATVIKTALGIEHYWAVLSLRQDVEQFIFTL